MLLAFLNTNGWSEGKWRTLIEEGKGYDVIGVGETGWHDDVEWREGDWVVIGRGRQVGEKKGGGWGVIVREKEGRSIEEIRLTKEMERGLGYNKGDIVTVKIREDKTEWWVTVVYMGVEGRGNFEDNRQLYETLRKIKEQVGRHRWVILGDLNGHIGLVEETVNRNGQLILNFVEEEGLRIKNWELEDPVTWRDRRSESAIDYIIVNEETARQGCRIWKDERVDFSDHFLIGITCGKAGRNTRVRKEIWKEKWNLKNADWIKYCREMGETMPGESEEVGRTVSEWERDIKGHIRTQAKKSVGVKKFKVGKTRLKGWWDKEVAKAIGDRKSENRKQRILAKQAKRNGGGHETEWAEAWERYVQARKAAQELIRRKLGKWEEEQARTLRNMPRREREKEAWKRLRRNLGGTGSHQDVKLKVDGREASSKEEVVPIIEDYWRRIVWKEEEDIGNLYIYSNSREMGSVEMEEEDIDLAVKAIKTGKAGGTDGIVGEFVKYGGATLRQALVGLFGKILEDGEVPQDWNRSRITLVHKGGGKSREDIGNYRPIAVMNILAKMFGWVINRKLTTWMEESKVLGEEQSGFRKNRGGLENVLVMKEIIEQSTKLGKELYLVFLDIEKAYDRVDRRRLLALLGHIGVDMKVVRVISRMYEDNEVQFTLGDVSTGWLGNNTGVRQGCVMSPTLFNIYIEELIARIRVSGKGVKVGERRLGCLAYADDLVLMADSKGDMEELLQVASRYGREWDVRFSDRKCKAMEFNSQEEGQWVLGNSILEVVDRYTYLGLEVSKEGIGGERQMRINEGKA